MPKKKKIGRPEIEIDFNVVKGFCNVWATEEEIADFFGCSRFTLLRRCKKETGDTFATFYKKNCTAGKMSLRRSQFKLATEGNPAMNIWLGKQHLGQSDKPEGEGIAEPQSIKITYEFEDASKKTD